MAVLLSSMQYRTYGQTIITPHTLQRLNTHTDARPLQQTGPRLRITKNTEKLTTQL